MTLLSSHAALRSGGGLCLWLYVYGYDMAIWIIAMAIWIIAMVIWIIAMIMAKYGLCLADDVEDEFVEAALF